jgi:hypothetical protein
MKHTGEADALVPELAARWRAKREHLNKLYLTICKEETSSKKIIYSSQSQDHTPSRIHVKSFKNVQKFIIIYIKQQKETSSAWAAAGKTEWQENNFMKLVISIWW